jgi:hypothetical protein
VVVYDADFSDDFEMAILRVFSISFQSEYMAKKEQGDFTTCWLLGPNNLRTNDRSNFSIDR